MLRSPRLIVPIVLAAVLAACGAGSPHLTTASASQNGMEAIFQDDGQLAGNTAGTIATLRQLGVDRIRLFVHWAYIAPSPNSRKKPHFDATNPSAYPHGAWNFLDNVITQAQAAGINVYLDLTAPVPYWATGPNQPKPLPRLQWQPNASMFDQFVQAVGKRYSGSYHGLPRVSFWSIWNEPNYGPDLAPQAHGFVEYSPWLYRQLLDSAWKGLHLTGHGADTILFGELAPRGYGSPPVFPGDFAGMRPLTFLRALYCVDSHFNRLRGTAAAQRGCPTSGSAAAFRGAHPALFQATGFAIHPYPQGQPPNVITSSEPDFADLAAVGNLMSTLDRVNRIWGSNTKFDIYNTEYGYQTRPPDKRLRQPSPATAAFYENWAEYISWKNQRIKSFTHYLLVDSKAGDFPSGFEFFPGGIGRAKPTYYAFRMPIFLPTTTGHPNQSLEVWGSARAADLFGTGPQTVQIQYQIGPNSPWQNIGTATPDPSGYFDVKVSFPGSGFVRTEWTLPAVGPIHSRVQAITLH
jgi:Cellulase (glycosyl hydrolase family 5)